MTEISFSFANQPLKVQVNKFSKICSNSLLISFQETNFLVASVFQSESNIKCFSGVNYKVIVLENFFAVNKIPTNYNRCEDRSTQFAILLARLIDRSIRPIISNKITNQIQTTVNLFSLKNYYQLKWLSIFAISLNLYLNLKKEFFSPVAAVILYFKNNKWELYLDQGLELEKNPKNNSLIFIAGIESLEGLKITTIEYFGKFLSNDEINLGIKVAKKFILQLISIQKKIYHKVKDSNLPKLITWEINPKIKKFFSNQKISLLDFNHNLTSQKIKNHQFNELNKILTNFSSLEKNNLINDIKDWEVQLTYLYFQTQKDLYLQKISLSQRRIDGRSFLESRRIHFKQNFFPSLHASTFLEKGMTQILNFITLDLPDKFKQLNTIIPNSKKYFFHAYRFHSFSTNQIKENSGFNSRREIGHGSLVENAIFLILPDILDFPYTIRSVSDILSSDGSTSQSSIIGNCLSLSSAGVPIKKIISGVSIGGFIDKESPKLLVDINAFEDEIGLFDLKVTSSQEGICCIQLDVKADRGLEIRFFKKALRQAFLNNFKNINKIKKQVFISKSLPASVPRFMKLSVSNEDLNKFINFLKYLNSLYFNQNTVKFQTFQQESQTIIFIFHEDQKVLEKTFLDLENNKSFKIKKYL